MKTIIINFNKKQLSPSTDVLLSYCTNKTFVDYIHAFGHQPEHTYINPTFWWSAKSAGSFFRNQHPEYSNASILKLRQTYAKDVCMSIINSPRSHVVVYCLARNRANDRQQHFTNKPQKKRGGTGFERASWTSLFEVLWVLVLSKFRCGCNNVTQH